MTGQKDKFYDLNQTTRGYVKFGDGSKVRIEGKGSIIFPVQEWRATKAARCVLYPKLV